MHGEPYATSTPHCRNLPPALHYRQALGKALRLQLQIATSSASGHADSPGVLEILRGASRALLGPGGLVRTGSGRLVRIVRSGSGRMLRRASLSVERVINSGGLSSLSQRARAYQDLEASSSASAAASASATAASASARTSARTSAASAASTSAAASPHAKRPGAAPWRLWGDRLASLAAFWLFCAFGLFLLFSELYFVLYFFGWGGSTPIGLAIYGHEEATAWALSLLGAGLMLCCCWSLSRAQIGVFSFRMESPQATDAGAMCFSSAVCCRIAIMLAYNVDLLLLPPHSGLQTQFYCTFANKSRMAIGGYDYYLLCCPLLLIALCLAFHFDLLSRWRNKMNSLLGKPYLAAMPLGSMIITQYEKQGACSTRLRACYAHAMRMPCTCHAHAVHVPCTCRAHAMRTPCRRAHRPAAAQHARRRGRVLTAEPRPSRCPPQAAAPGRGPRAASRDGGYRQLGAGNGQPPARRRGPGEARLIGHLSGGAGRSRHTLSVFNVHKSASKSHL